MLEEWRAVADFEGSYEVSNLGRVRSLDRVEIFERVIWQTGARCVVSRRHKGKILIPEKVKGNNYLRVGLGNGNKVYVHTIVLTAFKGAAPEGCECLHGDGDRTHNTDFNLRWGTRLENVHDAIKHGTANSWGHRSHA